MATCHPAEFIGQKYPACWAFVIDYYSRLDIRLASDTYRNAELFYKIEQPTNGCLAILGHTAIGDHCGIYFDDYVYHHTQSLGIVRATQNQFAQRAYYAIRD